jgi:hypothetical protein
MLVDNIDEDMILSPAAEVDNIDNFLIAPLDINYPENTCNNAEGDDDSIYCRLGGGGGKDAAFLGLLMVLGVSLVFRRRRRVG